MSYWKRLGSHPGTPVAVLISFTGLVVGFLREDGNWWFGLIASIYWIPVLLTSRKRVERGHDPT